MSTGASSFMSCYAINGELFSLFDPFLISVSINIIFTQVTRTNKEPSLKKDFLTMVSISEPKKWIIPNVVIGYYFFGNFPDNWTFLGLLIIVISGIYISRREVVKNSI